MILATIFWNELEILKPDIIAQWYPNLAKADTNIFERVKKRIETEVNTASCKNRMHNIAIYIIQI